MATETEQVLSTLVRESYGATCPRDRLKTALRFKEWLGIAATVLRPFLRVLAASRGMLDGRRRSKRQHWQAVDRQALHRAEKTAKIVD